MQTITGHAYARAGLLGNPSDGYNGKTISLIVKNYSAQVHLSTAEQLTLVPAESERNQFESIDQLFQQVQDGGYYGGIRLLKAAIKRFYEYGQLTGQSLTGKPNFSMSYESNIPRQVGMAGSSAIVTAALRALMQWYEISIPPHLLASLTLSAESELGIPAGLQDRVIQAYEGVVYMDFSTESMQSELGLEFGKYESINSEPNTSQSTISKLANHLYIAFASNAGEPTEVLHNDLRKRFQQGDARVVTAMKQFADLAEQGKHALVKQDYERLGQLIDQNFDLRASICQLHQEHQRMIDTARSCGATAKYCGSGGAIVGTCLDSSSFPTLVDQMNSIGCHVIQPTIE